MQLALFEAPQDSLAPFFAFGLAFEVLPVLTLVRSSFTTEGDWSLANFGRAFTPVMVALSIVAIIAYFWRISRFASLLLLPYITWVTIAGFLNYANVQLNGPF